MHGEAGHPATVPLSRHALFETGDLDCARDRVAQKFCRHRLEIAGDRGAFRAVHNHLPGDMISLNYISYGADVMIDPGELGDFYLIQMPIADHATIRNGGEEFQTDIATASVLNPDLATRMHWWRGCAQILIQVRKEPFRAFAERVADRSLPGPLRFDPQVDFTRPQMLAWRRLAETLFLAAEAAPENRYGLAARFNEQRLLEIFLRCQPSNMSLFFDRRPAGAPPRYLRRAEEFLREHCDRDITLLDIATAAGVAPRTLQLAYRNAFGETPIGALQRERLRRVRFDLGAGEGEATVAETAMRWGLTHLGRFAAQYRNEFGERPSETARRARG